MASQQNPHGEDQAHQHGIASPTSTISSGYGQTIGTYPVRDDGLPQVVPDTSPEVLTPLEAEYKRKYLESNAPQTVVTPEDDTSKIVVDPAEHGTVPGSFGAALDSAPTEKTLKDPEGNNPSPKKGSTICGVRRKPFFIILVVVVIVLAAAIGGGVGGGLAASRSKDKADEASTSDTPTSSVTPTARSTSSTTTTSAVPTATFLNNQTTSENGFAFQGFSEDNFQGNITNITRAEGGTTFDFEINSYVWLPNITSCCVTFCANATSKGMIGWWCSQRKQNKTSEPFKRVFVWCQGERVKANAKCV